MKHLKSYLYIILCVCLGFACNDDKSIVQVGTLLLDVEEDAILFTKAENKVTYESLQVAILQGEEDAQDTIKVYNDYLKEVKDQRLILPIGKYTVAVRSNGVDNVGWETPFYQGQEEVEVKQGEITNTKIVCKIANTKVSVIYSDSLKNHFLDYQTVVSNSFDSLTFTRDEYRSGYFTPEKLTVKLNLVNHDGNKFTIKKVYSDIKPQYHYKFKFSLEDGDGNSNAGGNFEIEVDDSYKEISNDIFIKEEDLFGKGKPYYKLEGFDENNKVSYRVGTAELPKPIITLSAPAGVKSLQVKADSYQLSGLPVFDLTNLSSEEQNVLGSIGFPILDKESLKAGSFDLDFQTLISNLEPNGLKTGIHTFSLELLDQIDQETTVTFSFEIRPDVKVSVENPIVWAKFATLRGNSADVVGQIFMIRKVGETEYKPVTNVQVDPLTGDVTALVMNLEADTEYEYYLVSGEEGSLNQSEPTSFTTDDMPTVPNLNFDDWCESGGVVYPNASQSNAFWDSGNEGAKTVSLTPTEGTSDIVVKGKAAYLHTEWVNAVVVQTMAAGNIYTGSFREAKINLKNPGAILDFGRPYTGRPTKLSGYYRYIPKKVDKGGHGELKIGSMDKCSIYIVLCDWTAPYVVNTQNGDFVDLSSPSILAYGELSDAEASREDMPEYEKFEIDIKYRDTNRKPSYILIVASASKYGDYFTGGVGSTLYIDEFELSFDYNENSFK